MFVGKGFFSLLELPRVPKGKFKPLLIKEVDGETVETVTEFIFWAPKSLQMVTVAMKLKDTCSLEEKL